MKIRRKWFTEVLLPLIISSVACSSFLQAGNDSLVSSVGFLDFSSGVKYGQNIKASDFPSPTILCESYRFENSNPVSEVSQSFCSLNPTTAGHQRRSALDFRYFAVSKEFRRGKDRQHGKADAISSYSIRKLPNSKTVDSRFRVLKQTDRLDRSSRRFITLDLPLLNRRISKTRVETMVGKARKPSRHRSDAFPTRARRLVNKQYRSFLKIAPDFIHEGRSRKLASARASDSMVRNSANAERIHQKKNPRSEEDISQTSELQRTTIIDSGSARKLSSRRYLIAPKLEKISLRFDKESEDTRNSRTRILRQRYYRSRTVRSNRNFFLSTKKIKSNKDSLDRRLRFRLSSKHLRSRATAPSRQQRMDEWKQRKTLTERTNIRTYMEFLRSIIPLKRVELTSRSDERRQQRSAWRPASREDSFADRRRRYSRQDNRRNAVDRFMLNTKSEIAADRRARFDQPTSRRHREDFRSSETTTEGQVRTSARIKRTVRNNREIETLSSRRYQREAMSEESAAVRRNREFTRERFINANVHRDQITSTSTSPRNIENIRQRSVLRKGFERALGRRDVLLLASGKSPAGVEREVLYTQTTKIPRMIASYRSDETRFPKAQSLSAPDFGGLGNLASCLLNLVVGALVLRRICEEAGWSKLQPRTVADRLRGLIPQ